MIVLACETSTLLGSVAVCENGSILSFEESPRQGSHSEFLNSFIEKALLKAGKKLSDVDVFATGIGPGSFTGIRISLNTIKTLAYCFQKPVAGADSLKNLAQQVFLTKKPVELENTPIISMINAYKNMVYVASYKPNPEGLTQLKNPEVVRVQNLADYITEKSIVCGDGFKAYEKYFAQSSFQNKMIRSENFSDEPHAKTLAVMVSKAPSMFQNWNELLPLYLRASEAEENLKGIKFQPLI
jgi:tRNA threonylcarbamoyladenosine biosynthesis protein TsaB